MNTPMPQDEYLIERLNSDLATHGLGIQDRRADEAEQAHHAPTERMSAVVPMADMAPPAEDDEPRQAFAHHPSAPDDVDLLDRDDDHPAHGHSVHGAEKAHASTHLHATETDDSQAGNGSPATDDAVSVTPTLVAGRGLTAPAPDTLSAAAEARGVLDGVAHSLRTLAGRDAMDGVSVVIFPRGVDLLEVRMHISRDRDIDLNFRVAGPTPLTSSV